jgi:hypothetical protein
MLCIDHGARDPLTRKFQTSDKSALNENQGCWQDVRSGLGSRYLATDALNSTLQD